MKHRIASILFLSCTVFICCRNQEAPTQDVVAKPAMATEAIDTSITLDMVMGKFDPTAHEDFVEIAPMHSSRAGMYLHHETYSAFKKMHEAAKADSIELTILSATRNFKDQKRIWENKWNGITKVEGGQNLAETVSDPKERALIILKYSSMPGSSRHHWGTDIDINNFNNSYFESGQGLKEYNWLVANASEYGFCQPYTAKGPERPNGYFEEKWHWSYLPVAIPLTVYAEANLDNSMIEGFEGASTAMTIGIKERYILGINQACLAKD